MQTNFTLNEMVLNTVVSGKQIYHKDGTIHVIDYVKEVPDSPLINIHCVDGSRFMVNRTDLQTWEVNSIKENKKPNKKKSKIKE